MNNINDIKRKNIITEEQKRNKKNKYQRERYKQKVKLNPLQIRPYTKEEKERKKKNINKRQTLLQTQQGINKTESKTKIQGKNEK